jgi:hypothetical protein
LIFVRGLRSLLVLVCLAGLAVAVAPGCSLGAGTGTCNGSLEVPDCWSGCFDLHPDFFAAIPGVNPSYPASSTGTMTIRIQHGSDYESFSDGVVILIDDVGRVRGDPGSDGGAQPSLLGQSLAVDLSPGVVPPGVPITPVANPAIVHATVYLDSTCRTQDDALYAMGAVSGVGPTGDCGSGGASDAGVCSGATEDASVGDGGDAGAGSGVGKSTITFTHLFDNNPDESNASQRLSEGSFDFYIADPRNIAPGGLGPPPQCEGHLTGTFKFYFQRGRPAQPFP